MAQFNRVTIVGLGLMGGSLGLAIRKRRLAREVVGLSRSKAIAKRALQKGAVDAATTDPKIAVSNSDLVVLACPVDSIVSRARLLVPFMRRGSILMDLGSTKAQIVKCLERLKEVHFVGSHPLAGSEQQGIEAAKPDLFKDALCIITKSAKTNSSALSSVGSFWKSLGCHTLCMSPLQHDEVLSDLSHLPHAIAFSLVQSVDKKSLKFAPKSFLDLTRVAQSDPELWDDIFFTNCSNLLNSISNFQHKLDFLKKILKSKDRKGLYNFLKHAKKVRGALKVSR